jgi:hypothetical protein
MLDSILNADVLYYAYTVIGFLVFGLLLLILKPIVKRTKNKIDDKIVETLAEWHEVNKSKIKK